MATIGIMQPYVFPYIGYFQLIQKVDLFVFYNDVNFIKKGWIHRNRILLNGKEFLITIPCLEVSQNKRICDIQIGFDEKERNRLLSTLEHAYSKAPHFSEVYPIIVRILTTDYTHVDQLAISSVKEVSNYLNIEVRFEESRDRYGNDEMKREERLIDICLKENITSYINPAGGMEIYTKDYFQKHGVQLEFLKSNPIQYEQFSNEFVPWLSIIDVLMFNSRERIATYLDNFELV